MARVAIEDDQLIINMQGARKFLALKSTLSIPLDNVQAVTSCLKWKDAPGIFQPRAGTNIPNTYFGGTFWQDGNKVFYDLRKQEDSVVITLNDEDFEHVIIGVEDPNETIELIEKAIMKKD